LKSTFILLFFTASSLALYSQRSDTLYFKDKWKEKKTPEKKAKFYEVLKAENGVKQQTLYSASTQRVIVHEEHTNGLPSGEWLDNRYEGRTETRDYRFELKYSDEKVEGGIYPEEDEDSAQPATFPGGTPAFYEFLGRNLRYPAAAMDKRIQGKVLLHTKVTEEGDLQVVSIFKGVNKHLDQEAVRVMMKSPDWMPAKKDGESVDSFYIIPISFIIR